MKTLVGTLMKRNVIVAVSFLLLLSGLRAFTSGLPLAGLIIPTAFLGSLFWANSGLFKKGYPFYASLLSISLFAAFGYPIVVGSVVLSRTLTEWEYQSAGLIMVSGCNLAAASGADIELYMLNDRLKEMTNSPNANSNKILLIQNAIPIAEDRVKALGTDCGRRGHRDDHLWKTNWSAIKTALDATEDR
jgi:hypothetical protein